MLNDHMREAKKQNGWRWWVASTRFCLFNDAGEFLDFAGRSFPAKINGPSFCRQARTMKSELEVRDQEGLPPLQILKVLYLALQ